MHPARPVANPVASPVASPASRHIARAAPALALIATAALARPALAGPELSVGARLARATSVVEVQVTLRDRPSVVTKGVLYGPKVPGDVRWLGVCLPHKPLLKRWIKTKRRHHARAVWKQAASQGSYRALVFIAGGKPVCGVEAMAMRHTSLSPAHGLFREALRLAIKLRKRHQPPR